MLATVILEICDSLSLILQNSYILDSVSDFVNWAIFDPLVC